MADDRSPHTRTQYAWHWAKWKAWADQRNISALPADPEQVALYLIHRTEVDHVLARSVRSDLKAIVRYHRDTGHPSPGDHEGVKRVMRGLRRRDALSGSEPHQAEPLLPEVIERIRMTACIPRKHYRSVETVEAARKRGAKEIALCSTLATAGLRISEAAALRWRQVSIEADGSSGRIYVQASKGDQFAEGAVVAIPVSTVNDLKAIYHEANPSDYIFETRKARKASTKTLVRWIKLAVEAAGYDPDSFSGHSGRVAMARRMSANNAPVAVIQKQGRWKTASMVAYYARNEDIAEALKYLD